MTSSAGWARRTASATTRPVTPGSGASPAGEHVGDDHDVGAREGVGELLAQGRDPAVAVRLEHHDEHGPARCARAASITAATSVGRCA